MTVLTVRNDKESPLKVAVVSREYRVLVTSGTPNADAIPVADGVVESPIPAAAAKGDILDIVLNASCKAQRVVAARPVPEPRCIRTGRNTLRNSRAKTNAEHRQNAGRR